MKFFRTYHIVELICINPRRIDNILRRKITLTGFH